MKLLPARAESLPAREPRQFTPLELAIMSRGTWQVMPNGEIRAIALSEPTWDEYDASEQSDEVDYDARDREPDVFCPTGAR